MTTLQKVGIGVVVILSLLGAIGFVRTFSSSNSFGATTFQQGEVQNNPFIFVNGFSAGSSQQLGVDASGNLNVGKSFSQLTSNAATSTAVVGCVQTTATSTATPIRLVYSSIATSSPTFGTNTIGLVGWQYGTCPI